MRAGLFDWQTRFEQLDNGGDPLVKLNEVVNWELFAATFNRCAIKPVNPMPAEKAKS